MISKKHKQIVPSSHSGLAGVAMALPQACFWVEEHDQAGFVLHFFSFLTVVESTTLKEDKSVQGRTVTPWGSPWIWG